MNETRHEDNTLTIEVLKKLMVEIMKILNELEDRPSEEAPKNIGRALVELNIQPNIKGYYYLKYAIEIVSSSEIQEKRADKIYEKVAQKFAVNPKNVLRDIRYAIKIAKDKYDEKVWKKYFVSSIPPQEMTNITFIVMLSEHFRKH